MEIPRSLLDLVQRDRSLTAVVNGALAAFDPILRHSQLPFFPEYTDHGPEHNMDVLQTALDLMTDTARGLISPEDAACIVLATHLHDCAMHLSEDGFVTLLRHPDWPGVSGFDNAPWMALWEDFLSEARRFDGRKLTRLFGDSEPIRHPPLDPNRMERRDRLLIGEFLRRHDPRLAHEIALVGMPGPDGNVYPVVTRASPELKDLVGTIARSHGMPLRATFQYLETNYHLQEFQNIHAIYLMTLLRIADHVQIQPKRAPTEIIEVRKLRSPISQQEWKVHASIRNITAATPDPDAIFIDAMPPDVATYLRCREWLDDLQSELDKSWAVLGEVYGRFREKRLDQLHLRLRRVRSNIDNGIEFARSVDYLPDRVTFDSANPDLLKLLVGPLYGERPEIGIRELLQNAVDAVRERQALAAIPELSVSPPPDPPVTIAIEMLDDVPATVVVEDHGIGMNADIVRNYFLWLIPLVLGDQHLVRGMVTPGGEAEE